MTVCLKQMHQAVVENVSLVKLIVLNVASVEVARSAGGGLLCYNSFNGR